MNGIRLENGECNLISIVFPKFKIDSSYSRGKEICDKEISWSFGVNWDVNTTGIELDILRIYIYLDMIRIKDGFNIVKMDTCVTYEVCKNLSFADKYKFIENCCNDASAQVQGAWHVKVYNPSLAKHLPQTYNKVLELETVIKESIYQKWE